MKSSIRRESVWKKCVCVSKNDMCMETPSCHVSPD